MMSYPPPKSSLAIVGGGISGLTLALALNRHSIPLTIYEAAPNFAEIGAGVSFGPNAQRAMALLHPAIYAAFEKCKTVNMDEGKRAAFFTCRVGDARRGDAEGFVKRKRFEEEGKKVGDALFGVNFSQGVGSGGVYRAKFLDELVKSLPEGIAQFGKRLVNITDARDGSGGKVLHFEGGTAAQHTAIVGCDGIKSVTRKIVLGEDDPAAKPIFSGKYAYRGLIPMEKAVELVGEEEARNSQMYFGYGGHVLTFPIEMGKTTNVVAFASRPTWNHQSWVVRTSKSEMASDFASWGPTVRNIIADMQKPDIWALFYHLPARTFISNCNCICLLGDAAHATTPHQGAGAGMCLEDVLILSNLLKDVTIANGDAGNGDLKKVFKVFDEIRRPRTLKNVVTSLEAGKLYDFEGEGVGDDLDALEKNFTDRMEWVWGHDLEEEIELASGMLSR